VSVTAVVAVVAQHRELTPQVAQVQTVVVMVAGKIPTQLQVQQIRAVAVVVAQTRQHLETQQAVVE
jgi:hypothetical protein